MFRLVEGSGPMARLRSVLACAAFCAALLSPAGARGEYPYPIYFPELRTEGVLYTEPGLCLKGGIVTYFQNTNGFDYRIDSYQWADAFDSCAENAKRVGFPSNWILWRSTHWEDQDPSRVGYAWTPSAYGTGLRTVGEAGKTYSGFSNWFTVDFAKWTNMLTFEVYVYRPPAGVFLRRGEPYPFPNGRWRGGYHVQFVEDPAPAW